MAQSPRIFHLIQRAHSALFRAADTALRKSEGVTTAQHGVLLALSLRNPMPITAIADELKMGKSSLTGLVDRMSETGLVRREVSPEDGRGRLVYIQPEGRKLVERTLPHVKRYNGLLLSPFSKAECRTIERFLSFVAENAEGIVGQAQEQEDGSRDPEGS